MPTEAVGWSLVALQPPARTTVLTYDDGPTPGTTDLLLPVLAEAGATATFFVLLTRVRACLGLIRDVLDAGHEIGLHGIDHRRLTSLPADVHLARFRDGKAELEDLVGAAVRWSRPPYGAQDAASWRAARDVGLQPVLWSVACHDWETHAPEQYLSELRTTGPAAAVVLLHDGFADQTDGVDDGPAPALDRGELTSAILEQVSAQDLRAASLGEVLESSAPVVRPWFDEG